MTPHDRKAFGTLMFHLSETYGEPVSDARLEIYWGALIDLDLPDLRRAATLHVRTSKFFPRPSELREALSGAIDERADCAWVKLLTLVRRVGYTGTPDFGDDVALRRAALELFGGWTRLCQALPADGPALLGFAKEFKATYRAYARRETRDSAPIAELPPRDATVIALASMQRQLRARR